MKFSRRSLAAAAAAALLITPLASLAQDIKPRLIRFGYGLNEQSNQGRAVKYFASDRRFVRRAPSPSYRHAPFQLFGTPLPRPHGVCAPRRFHLPWRRGLAYPLTLHQRQAPA